MTMVMMVMMTSVMGMLLGFLFNCGGSSCLGTGDWIFCDSSCGCRNSSGSCKIIFVIITTTATTATFTFMSINVEKAVC